MQQHLSYNRRTYVGLVVKFGSNLEQFIDIGFDGEVVMRNGLLGGSESVGNDLMTTKCQ